MLCSSRRLRVITFQALGLLGAIRSLHASTSVADAFDHHENMNYDNHAHEKRNLLSLSEEGRRCLRTTNDLHAKPELSQLKDLTTGPSRIWAQRLTEPVCAPFEKGEQAFCDVRRIFSTDIIDFDLMKSNCEGLGGEFVEFDARFRENTYPYTQDVEDLQKITIKRIPVCLDKTMCPSAAESAILVSWIWPDSYGIARVRRSDGCDEKADDRFFIKYTKKGERKTMTCGELSNMIVKDRMPLWMSKDPCEKSWSPDGDPAPAKYVCPVTCRQDICKEDPQREFIHVDPKYPSLTSVKTCDWLSNQQWKPKKFACRNRFFREEKEFPFSPTPSAYSACPETCEHFIDRQY